MLSPPANPTLLSFAQGLLGILAFSPYIVPVGFLARCFAVPAPGHPIHSSERHLWNFALGLPLAVLICTLAGRILSATGVNVLFCAIDLLAVWFWLRSRASPASTRPAPKADGWTWIAAGLMALFAAFCLVETADIQIGKHVYISTVLADWSVRLTMVNAAMRSRVPPINGLSTVSAAGLGYAPHLRYYYFWYVAVAQVARTFRLSAEPALAASSFWAGWGFIATAFLCLKHLLGVRQQLRAKCLLLLGIFAVLGLDLLPTAWLWLSRSHHPYPEMEWWHQDRTPSFLGSVLYAPHHFAAWCALNAGLLVLFLNRPPASALRRILPAAVFAGCAFAAAAGLSIFPTFCFVFVLLFWAVDLLRRRDWGTVGALAAAGLIALVLAHPYLRELSAGSSAAAGFVNLSWRNDPFVAAQFARTHFLSGHSALVSFLIRQPVVLALDLFELGFYALILCYAVRRDLLTEGRLGPGLCAWWALLLGAAVPALFLTSTATSGPNDLGVDAGFLFRFALQLRAVEWLWHLWHARRPANPPVRRWMPGTAAILLGLGLGAQLYQILSIRFYFPLIASGFANKQMDALTRNRLSERLYNIRSALRQFDAQVPPSHPDTEAIQFNPVGAMMPAEVYFNDHQVASWDTGCGTSYGGDYAICAPIYHDLLFLYGNTEAGVLRGRAQNDRQDAAAARVATALDLAQTCTHLKLRAVVAESTDSIWQKPDSWVWSAPPLVANSTVRVIACPAGSWRP